MALTSVEKLGEAFSLALEYRAPGTQDLVSNANAILFVMRNRNGFKTYSGATIRVRQLYNETGSYTQLTVPNKREVYTYELLITVTIKRTLCRRSLKTRKELKKKITSV